MNDVDPIPEYAKGRRKISANTHRLMESYKDDYPSHAKGICQEVIQNSIDARFSEYSQIKITIKYDSEKRTLQIRDYGTTGMPHCKKCFWGRKRDSDEDCHEQDCNWGNFHYLGGLAKRVGSLGSRGQGKSLLIVAGERTIIRTKIANLTGKSNSNTSFSMASQWIRHSDDWEWELIPEKIMTDKDPPGTEITIYNVLEEVHQQLLKVNEIVQDISRTWCGAIKKGVQIRYGLANKDLIKIGSPHFPSPVLDKGRPAKKTFSKIPISYHNQIVGELKDIVIILAEEAVPEEIRGIALIKNGNQVITRITDWGRKNRRELQDKIFGWANYECTPEQPFLCYCEEPGHRGFTPHSYYTKVYDTLQKKIEDFLAPFEKEMFKPRLTQKDRKRAQQNLDIIKKALEEVNDFNPWSGLDEISVHKKSRIPPSNPYISAINLDKKFYQFGETAHAEIVILNPTTEYQKWIHLTVESLDKGLSQLNKWEYPPHQLPPLDPATTEKKGRITVNVDIQINDDFSEGKNFIRCTLKNNPPINVQTTAGRVLNDETPIDSGSHSIWVVIEPEVHSRKSPSGGTSGEGGKTGTINDLIPLTDPTLDPIEFEVYANWSEGEIWFFTKGARIEPVYETQPRVADSILYELIAEAITEKRLKLTIENNTQESFGKKELLNEFKHIEELRKKFLRACEKYRSSIK